MKKELGSLDIYQALNPMFIDYQTLPDNLKNQFVTTNGSHFFILAHPREVVFKDLRKAMDYFSQLNDIGNIKTDYQVAGINYVTTEIVRYIEKDSLPILIAVLLTLFLTVLFLFRNLKDVFVILTTLIVGVLFMLALMVSFEVKFNLLNIAIIPIILGMGIDSIIHICYRIKEKKDSAIVPQVLDIFPVLVLSNFTSILGFAVMIFASFNGIKTIGIVSCIGLFSILVISLVFLPFFLPFFYKENKD